MTPGRNTPSLKRILNANLSEFTTFRLGGPCRELIDCASPQQLESAVQELSKENKEFILIGGGSNLVVSDQGVDCVVIRYFSKSPLIVQQGNDVTVSGSTRLDDLAKYAAQAGLDGLNYTSGIPGTVGGAIVGNAGAFGRQVGDVLKNVVLIDYDNRKKTVSGSDLGFSYRNSKLKQTNEIVSEAVFALYPGDRDKLLEERNEILKVRSKKHPDLSVHPCAGSFFRNVEPTSNAGKRQAAGWFLEQAGGKDLAVGGAKIFDKHANIIVKGGNCKAQDVYELQKLMVDLAKRKFGLELVREVRFVGKFDGMTEKIQEGFIW